MKKIDLNTLRKKEKAATSSTKQRGAKTGGGTLQVALRASRYLTWQQAVDYATGCREGGHTDWRLPTLAEAKKIARVAPKLILAWTSESRGSEAAFVALNGDYSNFVHQGTSRYVRALPVRSCKRVCVSACARKEKIVRARRIVNAQGYAVKQDATVL